MRAERLGSRGLCFGIRHGGGEDKSGMQPEKAKPSHAPSRSLVDSPESTRHSSFAIASSLAPSIYTASAHHILEASQRSFTTASPADPIRIYKASTCSHPLADITRTGTSPSESVERAQADLSPTAPVNTADHSMTRPARACTCQVDEANAPLIPSPRPMTRFQPSEARRISRRSTLRRYNTAAAYHLERLFGPSTTPGNKTSNSSVTSPSLFPSRSLLRKLPRRNGQMSRSTPSGRSRIAAASFGGIWRGDDDENKGAEEAKSDEECEDSEGAVFPSIPDKNR
ncbi:hypothetical protein BDY17DRAFT_25054 [Neohortaea acidophila]|uniref:Uncharacterized protein n=1 Tax=Neohortaea acidophila TaxID=245834 RepID=A0A6A6Q969_9PEZI|nr:uncharacterized protein BDY17DRAFT_25054 [Neohortaea acidophila]KAF2488173.1 hypothetical protein BDY17DRAFT_25054 [Neohortaea acidophila]